MLTMCWIKCEVTGELRARWVLTRNDELGSGDVLGFEDINTPRRLHGPITHALSAL
jgi:hypothetical protein